MRQLSMAPPSTNTARTTHVPSTPMHPATQRVATEVDALWTLTERLAALVPHPGAALELVTSTAGELTHADAAAVLLHPGSDVVLASRWGIVGVPLGYKSPEVRRTLDGTWAVTASMPIRSGSHEIGCVWVARSAPVFTAEEQRVLRTLASVTSLALPMLVDAEKIAGTSAPGASDATTFPAKPVIAKPADHGRMVPETRRLSVFPPSLTRLLRAIDASESIDAIAAIVDTDPVLTAFVIRAGNSAADGPARPARTARDAVLFLGLQRLRALALAKFTRNLVAGGAPLDVWLWEQAIGTAVRTHQMLLVTGRIHDAEAGRLAGLLEPMGSIALATAHAERYDRALRTALRDDRPLDHVEREVFGIDGATLTQQLLHAWHLGPALAPSHRGEGESTMRWAIVWATHVTLAANPIWRRLQEEEDRPEPPAWVTGRVAEAAYALGISADVTADAEQRSLPALAEAHRILALPI